MKHDTPSWNKTAERIGRPLPSLVGDDGKPITGWRFPATSGKPRAVLVCLHGIQTHGAWYAPLAEQLRHEGVTLYCPNRRGSGNDPEHDGVARASARGWSDWVADTKTVIHAARREGAPVFLVGTSWGAKLALAVVTDGKEAVDGVLLVAPALHTTKETPWQKLKVKFWFLVNRQHPIDVPLDDEDYLPKGAESSALAAKDEALLVEMKGDSALLRKTTAHTLKQAKDMQQSALETITKSKGAQKLDSLFAARDRIVKNKASADELAACGAPKPLTDMNEAGHGVQVQDPKLLACKVMNFLTAKLKH